MNLLPPGTTAWILTDGKAGLETHCAGLADALGVRAERRLINPGKFWSALMPYGPADPYEGHTQPNSPIAPPFPHIVIASGRRTLPYLRQVKRKSQGSSFTVYMQDPAIGTRAADLICVPQHDGLRGENVLTSLTSPHGLTQAKLRHARAHPDARLARLQPDRLALILGGTSAHFEFAASDAGALAAIAVQHARKAGCSIMVTPSRRTPAGVVSAIQRALADAGFSDDRHFIWDGTGKNPYVPMMALATRLVVTGDSVNMVGEATATGQPVHIYLPSGKGHAKIARFHAALYEAGVARPYAGLLEDFAYPPLDCTPDLARQVAARYLAFQQRLQAAMERR